MENRLCNVCVILVLVLSTYSVSGIDVRYGGPVVFSFPCNDNPRYLTQEHEVPSLENKTLNMWKGIFYVEEWQQTFNLKLDIVMDNPAEITVNPRLLHVIPLDGTNNCKFRLTTLQPLNKASRIEFQVRGLEENLFPNVMSLSVNGLNLCDNENRETNNEVITKLHDKHAQPEQDRKKICGMRYPFLSDPESTSIKEWPWQSSIYYENSKNELVIICGGTLVAKNTILSVANCLKGKDLSKMLVSVGGLFNATVKEITQHTTFTATNLKDDIALIKLNDPESKKKILQNPICIYSEWGPSNGENSTIGSVNREKEGEFAPMVIIDSLVCLENNREEFGDFLSTKNFCATFSNSTRPDNTPKKVINGDGVYEKYFDENIQSFRWKIKGIASFTNVGSSSESSPEKSVTPYYIFTDVAKYLTWVEQNLSTIKL